MWAGFGRMAEKRDMVGKDEIFTMASGLLPDESYFIVDVTCSPSNDIEVLVDCDGSVSIDACVGMSRGMNQKLEELCDDFSLTVSSAGVGQPLKVDRQYMKLTGKPVEVVLKNGMKIIATLKGYDGRILTLSHTEKVAVEGRKRKQEVAVENSYPLAEVKSTREYLDFK